MSPPGLVTSRRSDTCWEVDVQWGGSSASLTERMNFVHTMSLPPFNLLFPEEQISVHLLFYTSTMFPVVGGKKSFWSLGVCVKIWFSSQAILEMCPPCDGCPPWGSCPLGFIPEWCFLFSVQVIYVDMGNETQAVWFSSSPSISALLVSAVLLFFRFSVLLDKSRHLLCGCYYYY